MPKQDTEAREQAQPKTYADWRAIVPREFTSTAINLVGGHRCWATFSSHQDWVNKARTRMAPGYVCFDSVGTPLHIGRDFAGAFYPVVIARKRDGEASS